MLSDDTYIINNNKVQDDINKINNLTIQLNNKLSLDSYCECCKIRASTTGVNKRVHIKNWFRAKKLAKLIHKPDRLGKYRNFAQILVNEELLGYKFYHRRNLKYGDLDKRELGNLFSKAVKYSIPVYEKEIDYKTTYCLFIEEILDHVFGTNYNINMNQKMNYKLPNKRWCKDHLCGVCQIRCKSSKKATCNKCK